MTVIWIVLELVLLLMFHQLPSAVENEEKVTGETRTRESRTDQESDDIEEGRNSTRNSVRHTQVSISTGENEGAPLFSSGIATRHSVNKDVGVPESAPEVETVPDRVSECPSICSRLRKAQQYLFLVASEIVKEEIVVLLAVLFMTVFSQTAIEVG